jgi:threonine dehydrogenase-like Zn-dependent dehydrogenase
MRSAVLDFADPAFPVSLLDLPEPDLPGDDWARIQVGYSGICASDLHAMYPDRSGSPTLRPFVPQRVQLGHEIGGTVVEAGRDCSVPVDTRVAVDQVLGCIARGLPPCRRCREGAHSACLRFGEGLTSGYGIGLTTGLGGGWSEQVVAHASQLHSAPEELDDRLIPLVEPLSVAVHGLLRRPPANDGAALVVGAGTLGLAAVAALRALTPDVRVAVIARHEHQEQAALELGAHRVVRTEDETTLVEVLAQEVGVGVTGRGRGAMLLDGFTTVVEAVGSGETIGLAARLCAKRGVVHLLGAAARVEVDFAPFWFKELDLVGSFCHGVDSHRGSSAHSFSRAIEILGTCALLRRLVTHVFPLDELQRAVEIAACRDAGAIKVLLAVNPP